MSIRPSGRVVLPSVPALAICDVSIRENASQEVRVSVMACCVKKLDMCIAQGAAKTFTFTDEATVDYSGATAITFDVWDSKPNAGTPTSLLSYSVSGGEITLPTDNQFRLTIDNADSAALTAGRNWCEAWVTLSGGERRLVGAGVFEVIDTWKHD